MPEKHNMNPYISIIIVTYNADPLTHLCLWSLACSRLRHSEVIMIDNAINDSYTDTLAREYPFIKLIHNKSNEGFGKACNLGFNNSRGDLVLFLNPDTIVPSDFETKIISFFEKHPNTGAMGGKMTDGRGDYLKESKRNFPYPTASFFKISGLNKLVPKARKEWQYYARHISEHQSGQVEILPGAFMVVSRHAMKKTGGFDPRFFLYAEDIDLSWQIYKSGLEVWYNPEIEMVHLKGETTKKTPTYSSVFYESMIQFYIKHFSHNHNRLKMLAIIRVIKFLSAISFLSHKIKKHYPKNTPSTFYLHPQSSPSVVEQVESFSGKKIIFKKNGRKKNLHLLISTESLDPTRLVELINNSIPEKYKALIWHKESGWLIELNDNRNHCRTILQSTIK